MEVIAGWFLMENLLKWMVYVDLIMLLHHFIPVDPMLGLFAHICGKPCFLTSVGII